MYTQFFGNFLLANNYVDKDQLFQAICSQKDVKYKLATLCIYEGLLAAQEVLETVEYAEENQVDFSEAAVALGLVTEEELLPLTQKPGSDYLLLAQALVENGIFNYDQIQDIIVEYRSYNEIYDLSITDDVAETVQNLYRKFFVINGGGATTNGKMYMELLFNNFIRLIGDDFVPVSIDRIDEYATGLCSLQKIEGIYSLNTYLDMDEATAKAFAVRYIGEGIELDHEYVMAAMNDFINLHNGLFTVNVSNENSDNLILSPLEELCNQGLEFSNPTYKISILYPFGMVHVLLEVVQELPD